MHLKSPITAFQFSLWRVLFSLYLIFSFVLILPYAESMYGQTGVIPDPRINWTYGFFPNLLSIWNQPIILSWIAILLSVALGTGYFRRSTSFVLWYLMAAFYNRNNLTEDPSLAYIGWLLLALVLISPGESFKKSSDQTNWYFPSNLYWGAWILLGASNLYSGIAKLFSPSWSTGEALQLIFQLPISYQWSFGLSEKLSFIFPFMTWAVICIQMISPLLFVFSRTRFLGWGLSIFIHISILLSLQIAQISLAMILFHLFLFDLSWVKRIQEKL